MSRHLSPEGLPENEIAKSRRDNSFITVDVNTHRSIFSFAGRGVGGGSAYLPLRKNHAFRLSTPQNPATYQLYSFSHPQTFDPKTYSPCPGRRNLCNTRMSGQIIRKTAQPLSMNAQQHLLRLYYIDAYLYIARSLYSFDSSARGSIARASITYQRV